MEYAATFHDAEANVTALVYASNHKAGGFAVALRDDDANEVVGISYHGLTFEAAITKAKSLVAS